MHISLSYPAIRMANGDYRRKTSVRRIWDKKVKVKFEGMEAYDWSGVEWGVISLVLNFGCRSRRVRSFR
jgi:hypothetical protein